MKTRLVLLLLILALPAWATIAPVGGTSCTGTCTYSPTTGNTVIIFASAQVGYCYDNNFHTMLQGPNNGTALGSSNYLLSFLIVAYSGTTSFGCLETSANLPMLLYE